MNIEKKFEKFDAFKNEEIDIDLIRDILLEVKHEYPEIKGTIRVEKYGEDQVTIIDLLPMKEYNESCMKVKSYEKRMQYYNLIIEVSSRIEDATKREVRILYLFNETSKNIEIWINDPKKRRK